MADNYLQFSERIEVPAAQMQQADEIIKRVEAKIEAEDEYFGVCVELERGGIWLYADEHGDTDHLEALARALVEELEIDEPFTASWSYTCSKPRIGEFGGGAMVVRRGYETLWADAESTVGAMDRKRILAEENKTDDK
jgi:hypothetical protein